MNPLGFSIIVSAETVLPFERHLQCRLIHSSGQIIKRATFYAFDFSNVNIKMSEYNSPQMHPHFCEGKKETNKKTVNLIGGLNKINW